MPWDMKMHGHFKKIAVLLNNLRVTQRAQGFVPIKETFGELTESY